MQEKRRNKEFVFFFSRNPVNLAKKKGGKGEKESIQYCSKAISFSFL